MNYQSNNISKLSTESRITIKIIWFVLQVNWCMNVICHGLSLQLSEHETIKDCVNVYCDWLTALFPNPRLSVPRPICEDVNLYARKIISHMHNLFVPRQGEGEIHAISPLCKLIRILVESPKCVIFIFC